MKPLNAMQKLDLEIAKLEQQRKREYEELKQQLGSVKKSLQLSNVIKEGVQSFAQTSISKENIIQAVTGIGLGYLSRKFISDEDSNFLKKSLTYLLQYKLTDIISGFFIRPKKEKS